jgi:large subunit ribosomal protein L18
MAYRHIRARRRSSETNYKRRIALLKGGMPRIVIRKTNKRIIAQIISYSENGDKTVAYADSNELVKVGWPSRANTPTAYLTGMLLAKKAGEKVEGSVVLDIGVHKPIKSSVIFAGAKGAADGGIQLLGNLEGSEERIKGAHIAAYSKTGNANTSYKKENIDASKITELFEETKKKIMK